MTIDRIGTIRNRVVAGRDTIGLGRPRRGVTVPQP